MNADIPRETLGILGGKINKIAIPCHWDSTVLETICAQNTEHNNAITEIYGTLNEKFMPHGRLSDSVVNVERDAALNFREQVRKSRLNFSFLLNAPVDKSANAYITNYIEWIVGVFRADAITISSHDLMREVRKQSSDIAINVSTIARVSSAQDLAKYEDINPTKVVVQHDINRNFSALDDILKYANKKGIEVELLLTESCLRRCPRMIDHYSTIGQGGSDTNYHAWCNTVKTTQPATILNANFIRPEDMHIYNDLEIHNFKISGRSKPASWLPEVAKAYVTKKYAGNLIRLLGIDPKLKAEDWVFVSNPALAGFLNDYPRTNNVKDEMRYCNVWAKKLVESGDLVVTGTKYRPAENGNLCGEINPRIIETYPKK